MRICAHPGTGRIKRESTDDGCEKTWLALRAPVDPKVFSRVEIRTLCRPPMFLNLGKPCHYGVCFVHGCVVLLEIVAFLLPRPKRSLCATVHHGNVWYRYSINYAPNALALFGQPIAFKYKGESENKGKPHLTTLIEVIEKLNTF